MNINGLPETFWVVRKPSPVSTLQDICFPCTFERLVKQVRGGLKEEEIVGIFADETEATEAARKLLAEGVVRTSECLEVRVLVYVQVVPTTKEMTARELDEAALEAVENAVRQGEKEGFRHPLVGEVSMAVGEVELHGNYIFTSPAEQTSS